MQRGKERLLIKKNIMQVKEIVEIIEDKFDSSHVHNLVEHVKITEVKKHLVNLFTHGIKINITESDMQELQDGEEFNWNFEGVPVHIFRGEEQ